MIKRGRVHIGTSGWNYPHWRGFFYPEKMPQKKWLEFYLEHFTTVEINNTFYQLPAEKTFMNWHDSVPDDFVFAVKASRFITHMKKLKDPQESLSKFIDRSKLLKGKLGVILYQLPPRWRYNGERLSQFLKALPKNIRAAFEFRDRSWWNDDVYDMLKKHDAAFCIFELDKAQSPEMVTASFVYLRMHGPEGAYEGSYSDKELKNWGKKIGQWSRDSLDVYCYFDNDQAAFAAHNARTLKRILKL